LTLSLILEHFSCDIYDTNDEVNSMFVASCEIDVKFMGNGSW